MAEFTDVMCKAYTICKSVRSCRKCALHCTGEYEGCMICADEQPENYDKLEKIIMDWKPKPMKVYPTWTEWIREMNIRVFEPIPADIAEKLGIEPKEGAC